MVEPLEKIKPAIDYVGRLHGALKAKGVPETSMKIDECQKGAASASIKTSDTQVVIYWANKRLDIQTVEPDKIVETVKQVWRRDLRGPSIKKKTTPPS